jgi:hypothetical protein
MNPNKYTVKDEEDNNCEEEMRQEQASLNDSIEDEE